MNFKKMDCFFAKLIQVILQPRLSCYFRIIPNRKKFSEIKKWMPLAIRSILRKCRKCTLIRDFSDCLPTGHLKIICKRLLHKFNTFSEAGPLYWTGFF